MLALHGHCNVANDEHVHESPSFLLLLDQTFRFSVPLCIHLILHTERVREREEKRTLEGKTPTQVMAMKLKYVASIAEDVIHRCAQ